MSLPPDSSAALQRLVDQIDRAGLHAPISIMLDLISPFDVISSQLALFVRPLLGGGTWSAYLAPLTEATNWQTFRRLMSR